MNLKDIYRAQAQLSGLIRHTPLEESPGLGEIVDGSVWLKAENLQLTRAFKIRGALNRMLAVDESERQQGVVAASAGNHAQGVGYAAALLGIPATVVMPEATPAIKVQATASYGVEIVRHGTGYDEAEARARELAEETGRVFVSPYNDPLVVAGQGTVGLEIAAEMPEVDVVLVPAGGGGLVSGTGIALKAVDPGIRVIAVQSVHTPALYNHLKGTALPQQPSLAEGLAGGIEAGSITLDLARQVVDDVVLVEEADLRQAIGWTLQEHGWIIEASAASGIAALLTGRVKLQGQSVAVIITGGNLDWPVLKTIVAQF